MAGCGKNAVNDDYYERKIAMHARRMDEEEYKEKKSSHKELAEALRHRGGYGPIRRRHMRRKREIDEHEEEEPKLISYLGRLNRFYFDYIEILY